MQKRIPVCQFLFSVLPLVLVDSDEKYGIVTERFKTRATFFEDYGESNVGSIQCKFIG